MIKVVIIDDEIDAVNSIALIIDEYCPNVEIVGRAFSASEGRKEILKHQPDLVFLDVEMPRGSGFDLLEMLPDRNFEVVFITAYNHFAIRAFKYSAIDYILKPIDIDEFIEAVAKAEKRIAEVQSSDKNNNVPKYDVLMENVKSSKPAKIIVPTSEGQVYVNVEDISRIEAEGSYSILHTHSDGKILVSKNLKEFEKLLDESDFFRTHNSYLINLAYVKKYVIKDGGYIMMTDDTMVPLSRRKKDVFLEEMQNYIG